MRHFNGLTSYCWWKNSRSYSFLLYRREMEQRHIVRGREGWGEQMKRGETQHMVMKVYLQAYICMGG